MKCELHSVYSLKFYQAFLILLLLLMKSILLQARVHAEEIQNKNFLAWIIYNLGKNCVMNF